MEIYDNLKRGERGAWLSIAAYFALSVLKLAVGYWGQSDALKADGLNNTTDIIASVAVLVGLKVSQKPPDTNHHYGHLRAETISSLVASFIMAFVGLQVLFEAGLSLWRGHNATPAPLTAAVSFFCGLVMYGVYTYNIRLAIKTGSSSVKAAALDNRSDAFVSFGAAIGISASLFGLPIVDTITALLVALLILKTAYDIFVEAILLLTDGFNTEETGSLLEVASSVEGVLRVKDLKGRMHGTIMFLEMTVTVEPTLNVIDSHRITEEIEGRLGAYKPHAVVFVHIEPEFIEKASP